MKGIFLHGFACAVAAEVVWCYKGFVQKYSKKETVRCDFYTEFSPDEVLRADLSFFKCIKIVYSKFLTVVHI